MNIKKQLRNLKHETESKVTRAIIVDLLSYSSNNDELLSYIEDIVDHGLSGGNVSSMIYYSDTCSFYRTHIEEINTKLSETLKGYGFISPLGLFNSDWDNEDILVTHENNQNILAWWIYESVVHELYSQLEI